MTWIFISIVFKIKHISYILSWADPAPLPNKNVWFTHLLSGMEGLLCLVVQPIRSQRNKGCRPPWYNRMHTYREWRMQSLVFRLEFSDRPTAPHVLLACFMPHSDTVTRVFQFCDWSDDTGSSVIAGAHSSVGCYRVVPGATGLYPHLQNLNLKCTNVDMIKLNVLHDLFVSIFLEFCCLYCTVNFLSFIHINNGAGLGSKSVTTNSK